MDRTSRQEAESVTAPLRDFLHVQALVELSSMLAEYVRDIPFGETVRFFTGYSQLLEGLGPTPVFEEPEQVASESPEFRGPLLYALLFDLISKSVGDYVDFILHSIMNADSQGARTINDLHLACLSFKRMQQTASDGSLGLLIAVMQERGLELASSRKDVVSSGKRKLDQYWEAPMSDRLPLATEMSQWMEETFKPSFAWMTRQKEGSGHNVFLRWVRYELREQFLSIMGFASFIIVTPVRRYLFTAQDERCAIPEAERFLAEAVLTQFEEHFVKRVESLLDKGSPSYEGVINWMRILHRGLLGSRGDKPDPRVEKAISRFRRSLKQYPRPGQDDHQTRARCALFLANQLNYPVPGSVLEWLALNLYSLHAGNVSDRKEEMTQHLNKEPDLPRSTVIQQALRGLEYSETLAYACKKRYRDHLAHSCRVALYGLDLLDSCKLQDPGCEDVHRDRDLRSACWLYLSLLHDCGYVLEHLDYLFGMVDHLADTTTFRAFGSNLEHARGHLIYALSLAMMKDAHLEDKFHPKSVAHPLVSYDNAQRLLGYEAQWSVLKTPIRAIALHHSYEYVPLDPSKYEFWLALLDEFQEWGRAVAVPPDVAQFVQALLATGDAGSRFLETHGTVEVQDIFINASFRDESNAGRGEFVFEVGLDLPGDTSAFARTLCNPLYFVWDKWYKLNTFGRRANTGFHGHFRLSAEICCGFTNHDQVDNWLRYFETIRGVLRNEVQHLVEQLEIAREEKLLGARHTESLHIQREISGALLVLCCGLERGVKSTRDVPGIHKICRLKVERPPIEASQDYTRTMEFHRGYLPKGRSNWVAITDVDKIMAGKMSGMETVDPESLVKPPHKELVQERIGELHEAALGSLIGRHQAREIVERYRRAPWGS